MTDVDGVDVTRLLSHLGIPGFPYIAFGNSPHRLAASDEAELPQAPLPTPAELVRSPPATLFALRPPAGTSSFEGGVEKPPGDPVLAAIEGFRAATAKQSTPRTPSDSHGADQAKAPDVVSLSMTADSLRQRTPTSRVPPRSDELGTLRRLAARPGQAHEPPSPERASEVAVPPSSSPPSVVPGPSSRDRLFSARSPGVDPAVPASPEMPTVKRLRAARVAAPRLVPPAHPLSDRAASLSRLRPLAVFSEEPVEVVTSSLGSLSRLRRQPGMPARRAHAEPRNAALAASTPSASRVASTLSRLRPFAPGAFLRPNTRRGVFSGIVTDDPLVVAKGVVNPAAVQGDGTPDTARLLAWRLAPEPGRRQNPGASGKSVRASIVRLRPVGDTP